MALFGSGILGLIALVCAVWIIYDVIVNQKRMSTLHKVLWIVFGVFFSIITAIVYYFVVKK
ncbi:hypothetical protein C0585_03730 [Candidatus Woesearchaeota archaeon]|nr:MAG: hypothetical protein C0585_03730 [Candidatus Woesearchaeota archaeon]